MKQKVNIAWLLMTVCMIMLTASVLPHHHHENLLCLQHDVTEQSCKSDATQEPQNGSSCKDCCVTKFHCSRPDTGDSMEPQYSLTSILFTLTDIYLLPLRSNEGSVDSPTYYFEHLHTQQVVKATGLRAPPAIA